jgi:hypothetical protein
MVAVAVAVAAVEVMCVLAELAQEIMLVFAISAVVMDTAPLGLVLVHSTERLFPHLQAPDGMARPSQGKIIPTWGFAVSLAITDTVPRRPAGLSRTCFIFSAHFI